MIILKLYHKTLNSNIFKSVTIKILVGAPLIVVVLPVQF